MNLRSIANLRLGTFMKRKTLSRLKMSIIGSYGQNVSILTLLKELSRNDYILYKKVSVVGR